MNRFCRLLIQVDFLLILYIIDDLPGIVHYLSSKFVFPQGIIFDTPQALMALISRAMDWNFVHRVSKGLAWRGEIEA